MSCIASAYCPIVFAPCKVIMLTKTEEGKLNLLATGIALPPNPLTVILKRIILTGYPLKVHKKRAVIRYMFFNPKDVQYFRPVELYTKFGLKVTYHFLLIYRGISRTHSVLTVSLKLNSTTSWSLMTQCCSSCTGASILCGMRRLGLGSRRLSKRARLKRMMKTWYKNDADDDE